MLVTQPFAAGPSATRFCHAAQPHDRWPPDSLETEFPDAPSRAPDPPDSQQRAGLATHDEPTMQQLAARFGYIHSAREHDPKLIENVSSLAERPRTPARNWPPAPAIARQKLVGWPLATSLTERKPIRSCATPCIEERLDHSPTGVDPRSDPPVGIRTEWTTLASGSRRLVCRKRPQRRRRYRSPPRDDGRCGNIGRQARPSAGRLGASDVGTLPLLLEPPASVFGSVGRTIQERYASISDRLCGQN